MKIFLSLLLVLVHSVCAAQKTKLIIPAGHADNIQAIIVTPDNRYIVSTAGDATTKIWEKTSGRLVYDFPLNAAGKPYRFSQFIFRKKGKELLALGKDELVIFDFENFSILKEIPLQNFSNAVLASDDNTLFVSSQKEMHYAEITKYNLTDFSSITIYSINDADEADLNFSRISLNKPEDKLLCYTQRSGSSLIGTNGALIKIYPSTNQHAVWCFAPDGSLADIEEKSGNQDVIKFLDPETNAEKWQTTIQFKSNFSFYYHFQTAEFDKQKGVWVLASNESFAVLDYINHQVQGVYDIPRGQVSSIAVSPVSNEYFIGTNLYSGNAVYLYSYEVKNNKVSDNYGSSVFDPCSLKTPVSNKTILLGSFHKYFKQIDISKAGFAIKNLVHNYGSEKIGISADGKTGVSAASAFTNFYATDEAGNNYTEVATKENESNPNEIVFSADGKLMASINSLETVIINVAEKRVLFRYKTGMYAVAEKQGLGDFSRDNKNFISYSQNEGGIPTITCFNITLGKIIWTKTGDIYSFRFSADNGTIFCIDHANYSALWLNAQDGSIIKEKRFGIREAIGNAIITNDSKYVLINAENNIEIWNLETFEKTGEIKGHTNRISYTAFLEDEKYLVTSSYDNTIRLWDWKNQKELCRFILFEESEGWVALMPDGRFDASEEIMKKMYYARGKEIIPLQAVYEQFYTPMLINRIFNGEQFKPLNVDINNIKSKPTVKIAYAAIQRNLEISDDIATYQNTNGAAEITVTANAIDDAVDEIRLFQNGKILNLATRNLIVADDKTTTVVKKYTVSLLPGQNNIRAVALNTQRTESAPDEIAVVYKQDNATDNTQPIISYKNDAVISSVDKNATLHLVVVGINAYKNPAMSLNYALADATAFKDEVEKDAKSVITNIKTYFVTNGDADKTGITTALKEVQKNGKPQDVFIFYYAGHGVISNNEFYLVPNDVTDLKNVDAALKEHGIAAKELQQFAIDIPAQKQLFILDACQSAGAFETMLSSDGNQQKSIAVVARSTGTHWMAASGAQQFANEFSQLGHGAFTYVLLQALKGEAVNNKMITVNGLKNFLQLQVPALMKKYNGAAQYPASYGFGNDFPVEIINK